jgi:hypothetical protein
MWRAFFLALGIYACIFGAECLFVENFEFAGQTPANPSGQATLFQSNPVEARRDWKPPEWAPWSLLSTGAVVILYSVTLYRPGG